MKRWLLASTISAPLVFALFNSCASDSLPPSGGTGTTGAGGSDVTTGGTAGTATTGTTSVTTSGTAGSGPATTTTAATTTSTTAAGTGGNGGSTTVGTAGSAGAGTAGNGGAGGASGGAGGSAGGGTAGAKTDAGGVGGTGGTGGGECDLDCLTGTQKSNYGFVWKDSWFITGCYVKQMADCWALPGTCPGTPAGGGFEDSGSVARETFPLGGTAGQTYVVTFTLNGLSEAKFHQNGKWADPASIPAVPIAGNATVTEGGINNSTFYIGGTAVPSTYNVMRIRVLSPTKTEVARYYMNAFPNTQMWESHRVFSLSYTHSIEVPGGGFIEYTTEDSNCRAIDNCGAGTVPDNSCPAARNIPNEPADLALPATYGFVPDQMNRPTTTPRSLASMNVVNGAVQPWHSQLNHFKITKVALK